jgi:phosphatidylserine decarboxylase
MRPANGDEWLRRLRDRCAILPQYLLPQHALTQALHRLARSTRPWLVQFMIRTLIRLYRVELRDAAEPDPSRYASFNAFFTRALAPGARPLPADPACVAAPADGRLNEHGTLHGGRLLQAKGRHYAAATLLATSGADGFANGSFLTIYLAPRDYHRVHAPFDGALEEVTYVPGRLFSVSDRAARVVPELFARNERVILRGSVRGGEFALVFVGAMMVASVTLALCGIDDLCHARRLARRRLPSPLPFRRGDELGLFNLGSTVVLLLSAGLVEWRSDLVTGAPLRMGSAVGRWQDAPSGASARFQGE